MPREKKKPWKDLTREERQERERAHWGPGGKVEREIEAREAKEKRKAERQASRQTRRDTKQRGWDERHKYKNYGMMGATIKTKLREVSGKHEYSVRAYDRRGHEVGYGLAVGSDNYHKMRKKISSDRPIWIRFGIGKKKIETPEQIEQKKYNNWKKLK